MKRVRAASILVLFGAWLFFALPFIAVGPNDVEDYYTGVVTTKMVVDSMAQGAWPFWNMDSALGVPQPFRFHFITHPLSPICRVADCGTVLRVAAACQALIGALFVVILVRRLGSDEPVAVLAGLTFLFCSSIVQPTYLDDWSTAAIPEASLPILIGAAYTLLNTEDRRDATKWSLVLGGIAGFTLSMFFPFAVLAATAVFLLVQPRVTLSRWQWLSLAALVGVLICAAHVYHLAEQYRLTPIGVGRDNHEEPTLLTYASSALIAPLPKPGVETSWRTIFFGGPFTIAALIGLFSLRRADLRPFKLALIVSLVLLWIPESWLFNLMTHRWGYRSGINLFGIVLGACAIDQLRSTNRRARIAHAVMAVQIVALSAAFWPHWMAMTRAWIDPDLRARSQRVKENYGITAAVAALQRDNPGRVALAPNTYDLTRRFMLSKEGLAPNQLQDAGVPSLYAEAHGITLDPIAPMRYAFIGISPPTSTTVTNPSTLNFLGVRYVLAMPDDVVSERLHLVRSVGGVRIFENPNPWPEAFFVREFPPTPMPRVPDCGHDRFLCVDFERAGIEREPEAITIDRHRDGLTLTFAPSDRSRHLLVTQWYQPYWRVTEGSAHIVRAAEQLVGLEIPAGEQRLTIEYLPGVRAALFFVGMTTELVLMIVIAWLSVPRRVVVETTLPSSAIGRELAK
jgi:hypothetical protein